MIDPNKTSLLLVVSAPSGAGKTTLCERLLDEFDRLVYSVSCTTRAPRVGEVDGKDYHFISEDEFSRQVGEEAFLEFADVHGARYGTLTGGVRSALEAGRDVLMDIDVQGASQIRSRLRQDDARETIGRAFVDVFIAPPSLGALEERLRGRGKDDDATISRRLNMARTELSRWNEYQYLVLNDDLDVAYGALRAIYMAEHCRIRDDEPTR